MITFPITLPSGGIKKASVVFNPIAAVAESEFTFFQQAQKYAGARWEASIELAPMIRANAAPWIGALVSLWGRYGTFLLPIPGGASPLGVATGAPVIDGAAQTGQVLATKGWTASQTPIVKTGSYFHLVTGGVYRLHMVMKDANSDGAGKATLDIVPPLRASPGDNDPLTLANPTGQFRLAENPTKWDLNEALQHGLRFAAVEAL